LQQWLQLRAVPLQVSNDFLDGPGRFEPGNWQGWSSLLSPAWLAAQKKNA
jgi:hypothetical protein